MEYCEHRPVNMVLEYTQQRAEGREVPISLDLLGICEL